MVSENPRAESSAVRVVIEPSRRNSTVRTFHVAAELAARSNTDFTFPVDDDGYYFRLIGEFGQTLLLALQSRVRGLKSVTMSRYEIVAFISPAFDWDDVEPQILDVLTDFIGAELDVRRENDTSVFGMGFLVDLEDLLAAASDGLFTSGGSASDSDDDSQPFSTVAGDLFDDSAETAEFTDDDVEHFDGRVGGWPTG